jgi:transposase
VRDWVLRFNARGPDGLLDSKAPASRSWLNDVQRQALVDVVESGQIPAIHGVVRWRLIDLRDWIHDEIAASLDERTVSRGLKKLGYVKLTARLRHHAQNGYAMEAAEKLVLLPSWQRSGQPSRKTRP